MWKHLVTHYFSFTKKERTGIVALLIVIAISLLLPVTFPYLSSEKIYDYAEFEDAIASLNIQPAANPSSGRVRYNSNGYTQQYPGKAGNYPDYPQTQGTLFYFDPNTATPADWKRLGIRDKTITTIQRYLQKGGSFRSREDLGKIWGLRKEEVARLTPYVQIERKLPKTPYALEQQPYAAPREFKSKQLPRVIDINLADTTDLIALPGIGSKLSQRMLNFRDKLGGFYSVEQVSETFGLPDSTFQKIQPFLKLGEVKLKPININQATMDELKAHPYLRYQLANAIIQYRNQHGKFQEVEELKKLMLITEPVYLKIAPYLVVD